MAFELRKHTKPPVAREVAGKEVDPRYQWLRLYATCFAALVSLLPAVALLLVFSRHHRNMLEVERNRRVLQEVSRAKQSLDDLLHSGQAVLTRIVQRADPPLAANLDHALLDARTAFEGIVGLAVFDSQGVRVADVGQFDPGSEDPLDQSWFQDVQRAGIGVSDVSAGAGDSAHFVIAIAVAKPAQQESESLVLAAWVDADVLRLSPSMPDVGPSSLVFLLNERGVLQTPSQSAHEFLQRRRGVVPSRPSAPTVVEVTDLGRDSRTLAYVGLEQSPFILYVLAAPEEIMADWAYPWATACWILALSVMLVLASTIWCSSYLLARIRKADEELVEALHNVQYTNQMASIGRLAAGVAHEINNPLAIIEENAGLLSDLLTLKKETPDPERLLKIAETVRNSVARCAAITHGLLGFARTMEPKTMSIDVAALIEEVLSFERQLASYRNIQIHLDIREGLPAIQSDRGQLQQIFLNILTNAFDAVDDEGRIDISMTLEDENTVIVKISDNGRGIPAENLKRIFDPFFSTKLVYGTGLGLSITYGLVSKLGGSIDVQSSAGQGSTFTVRLPVKRRTKDGKKTHE